MAYMSSPPVGIGTPGRFGGFNNAKPSGANPVNNSDVDVPWYASGPAWVIVFLIAGYILVFQTLKG